MNDLLHHHPSPLQDVTEALALETSGTRLLIKRDDLLGVEISGNKARKLKYNIAEIVHRRSPVVVAFGGAYSNLLLAVAAAGRQYGFNTVGIVRGEPHIPLNPVLQTATGRGMQLEYMDRATFRHTNEPEVLRTIYERWGQDAYVIPDGASNCLGIKGAAEIIAEIDQSFDIVCCSCGTGGTLAGIVSSLPPGTRALGFSALKGGDFLRDDVTRLLEGCHLTAAGPWDIVTEFHFGGFAKRPPELLTFVQGFAERTGLALDEIYEGKMMYGLLALIERDYFTPGSTIVAIQAGGGSTGPAQLSGSA
ncbi:MAG TPA: pyridoxal-phosphate dependent enzyme [Acidimicrobiales bacterium]|nr:pyridoxal-phosphate dependent enzyme [Acidimicrobiales bacterium]